MFSFDRLLNESKLAFWKLIREFRFLSSGNEIWGSQVWNLRICSYFRSLRGSLEARQTELEKGWVNEDHFTLMPWARERVWCRRVKMFWFLRSTEPYISYTHTIFFLIRWHLMQKIMPDLMATFWLQENACIFLPGTKIFGEAKIQTEEGTGWNRPNSILHGIRFNHNA